MSGIYVHIPYCKTICHYCDFYKTANLRSIDNFIEALIVEIKLKKSWVSDPISSIYVGGGTPSVLSIIQLQKILDEISKTYTFEKELELTIEINPDDVSFDYLLGLFKIGFNRLSIGIQSFNDNLLQYLNRRHHSNSAILAVENAKMVGFMNISVDLIYGIPNQQITDFLKDLDIIEKLDVQHLSAYHLGIEENTYFGKLKNKGKFIEISEGKSEFFYRNLIEWSSKSKFNHYEVSNFARDEKYSKHNISYWFSVPYLGFGPSAHSYNVEKRFYNISNVNYYISAIENKKTFYEEEILTPINMYNEHIMLRCRTKWGFNLLEINNLIDISNYEKVLRRIYNFQDSNYLRIENDQVILTEKGLFISDYIIRDLIIA